MVLRFALGLCLAGPVLASAAELPAPFGAGEQLVYDVSLLGVHTAEARLEVEGDAGGGLRLSARGQTVGAADSLLRLRQDAWCALAADLQPRICRFTSHRRGSDRRREVKFDRAGKLVQERTLEDGRSSEEKIPFPAGLDGVQEALSGLYDLRRRVPEPGATVRFRSVRKGKALDVTATGVREKDVTTAAGTFHTVEVALRILQKDGDDETTEAVIWFSRDARRLPVLLRVAAPVGSVEASLRTAEGTVDAELARGAPGTTRGGTPAAP